LQFSTNDSQDPKAMKPHSQLLFRLPILTIALILSGCATSVTVQTDYDHSAAFGRYHTYACDIASSQLGPTNRAALEQSVRSSLAAHGITETSDSKADLYVIPRIRTAERLDVIPGRNFTYFRSPYGAYGYWDRARMPADVMQYTEGTLILDFVDRRTHKLVFRGVGQGVVSTNREKNTAAIQDAVNKIVAQFPAAGS
jgi:Domain of unknown function (DUF4136)